MKENAPLDDKALIEEALRRRNAREPGIPAEKVKKFIASIGGEIESNGGITKARMDKLLRQLEAPEKPASFQ